MENINFFIVFIEGLLSIFSPCILPILPIYLSMLSNSSVDEIKSSDFKSKALIKNTIFFVLGISVTFFMLGSSLSALGIFFSKNKNMIMILGGVIIIIMGLFYMGIIKIDLLNREKRLSIKQNKMSSISAFVLGFAFSFGWTPCIGPILASVLVMASSADNFVTSNLLILTYTIGFIVPFIVASLFYSKLYKKFDVIKKHMNEIKKIGGAFIIIAGAIMLIDGVTNINRALEVKENVENQTNQTVTNETDEVTKADEVTETDDVTETNDVTETDDATETDEDKGLLPLDFTLYDQYGESHTLSDYKGKVVFLNIWATWCPPCKEEMPYIEALYEEYNKNQDDVVMLGVASPNLGREGSEESIKEFLEENNYTFPVVFDEEATMIFGYGINSFPSTLIINKEGYITKYIPGGMTKEMMKGFIEEERTIPAE